MRRDKSRGKNHAKEKRGSAINTPYDDVYRTLLNDCSQMIIPVINEVFGENFTGNECIVFSPNEHFINRQDGGSDKRITDASFSIIGTETKKYLIECQSTSDNSMLIRIFEYATQIALDEGVIEGSTLRVEIPNCAVLFLRSGNSTPDKMQIILHTPGGEVSFDVMIMKVQDYSLEEIFNKNLLFLIPFYIFLHEKHLNEYNTDKQKLKDLKAEYAIIMERLDEMAERGELSAYHRKVIIEMSGRVLEAVAAKYKRVRKGVKSVMGGKVLEYEAKTIYREGMKIGIRKGKDEGRREGKDEGRREGMETGIRKGELKKSKEMAAKLYAMGVDEAKIAEAADVDVRTIRKWVAG